MYLKKVNLYRATCISISLSEELCIDTFQERKTLCVHM